MINTVRHELNRNTLPNIASPSANIRSLSAVSISPGEILCNGSAQVTFRDEVQSILAENSFRLDALGEEGSGAQIVSS